jgi:hypothetical protein
MTIYIFQKNIVANIYEHVTASEKHYRIQKNKGSATR